MPCWCCGNEQKYIENCEVIEHERKSMHFMDILCIHCTSRTFYIYFAGSKKDIHIEKQLNDICIKTCSRFLNVVAIANPNNLWDIE